MSMYHEHPLLGRLPQLYRTPAGKFYLAVWRYGGFEVLGQNPRDYPFGPDPLTQQGWRSFTEPFLRYDAAAFAQQIAAGEFVPTEPERL